jgi:hypothetical protein
MGGIREKEQKAKDTFIMRKDTNIEMGFSIFSWYQVRHNVSKSDHEI